MSILLSVVSSSWRVSWWLSVKQSRYFLDSEGMIASVPDTTERRATAETPDQPAEREGDVGCPRHLTALSASALDPAAEATNSDEIAQLLVR